jgi:hypothetical protein
MLRDPVFKVLLEQIQLRDAHVLNFVAAFGPTFDGATAQQGSNLLIDQVEKRLIIHKHHFGRVVGGNPAHAREPYQALVFLRLK